MVAVKTRTILLPASFCLGCLLILSIEGVSARDLKKDNRWHSYDEVVQPEGTSRTDAAKPVVPAPQPAPAQGAGAPEAKAPTSTGEVRVNVVAPVAGQPAGEGAAAPDPKRDNLMEAKKMLEEQLKRLQEARKARESEKHPGAQPQLPQTAEARPGSERDVVVLYLDPPEARPEVGDRFVSTVRLVNPPGKEFDELGFELRYDPSVLRVVDGDASEQGVNVQDRAFREAFPWETAEEHVNQVDPENGLVSYRAKWGKRGPLTSSGPVASVTFEVLQARDTDLSFAFTDPAGVVPDGSPATYVRYRGKDVLGQGNDPLDGVLDARVKFYDRPEAASEFAIPAADNADLETRIVISPSSETVQAGEEFDYLIEIVNPNRVDFDEIMLILGYNPKYLTPMDHDAGNYIRDGINLFDGDYHGDFPFNHHRRNEIDPRKGYMLYRMGTLRTALNGSGVVASVRFRASAPTGEGGTRLKVGFVEKLAESGLTRRGRDVLGDPDEKRDGFEVYPVLILPQGMTRESSEAGGSSGRDTGGGLMEK